MKILITSGGTAEKIDNIRTIVNNSTGRLGCAIASAFVGRPEVERIFYVCGERAVRLQEDKVDICQISDVASLNDAIRGILSNHNIDIIIHAMAVSDYRVCAASSVESIANSADVVQAMENANMLGNGKISSEMEHMVLLLKKNPKIIKMFSSLAPDATLVGFKLLDNVPRGTLIDAGYKLLMDNGCDFVLANDATQFGGDVHIGCLIDKDGNYKEYGTKPEIGRAIVEATVAYRKGGTDL